MRYFINHLLEEFGIVYIVVNTLGFKIVIFQNRDDFNQLRYR